jgi:hypothetical protein
MTVQGAGVAAEAVGAVGHEEGARALPVLWGAAGPLARAPRPPPDAPAFDAVAYGVAPPLHLFFLFFFDFPTAKRVLSTRSSKSLRIYHIKNVFVLFKAYESVNFSPAARTA